MTTLKKQTVPGWQEENNRLIRTVTYPSYAIGLLLVQQVGQLAEQQDHHPEMHLTYSALSITYWTHTAGGVSEKDYLAANSVNQLLSQVISE